MQKVPRIAGPQIQRVERSLTYYLNALHQRALHGNSVVGISQDHDITFIPTVLSSATCCFEVSTVSRILPLAGNPLNLPLAFHSPVLGLVNQSLKPQGGQDSPSSGPLDPPSRDLLGYRKPPSQTTTFFQPPIATP
jgi:hypothetical protein